MRRRILIAVALLSLVGACAPSGRAPAEDTTTEELPVLPIGGDVELTNQDGQPFSLSSLRGNVVLIFFGYTMCPDACPTTLSKLSTAYSRLTDEERSRVKAVYISIDPERDTPQVMKDHLSYFGVDAVGLTGTVEQVSDVARRFGAHFEKSQEKTAAGYLMSHTVSIFGLDAKGQTRLLIDYEASVDLVVRNIRQLLNADQQVADSR
ncbi:MAG: SCO family protein [Acidobacteria bacterium]|nr:SCO family protein [Acidobacteriota bacterium]